MKILERLKYYLIIISLIFFTNCKKNTTEYYNNGNIKKQVLIKNDNLEEFSKNEKLDLILRPLRNRNIDSTIILYFKDFPNQIEQLDIYSGIDQRQIVFHNNGLIKREGFRENGLPISEWKFYSNNEELELIRDIKFINGKPYINQEIYLNEKNDTIYEGNGFFELKYKDTVKLNEEFKAIVNLPIPFYKNNNSKIFVYLAAIDTLDFNNDFSNENEIDKVLFHDNETDSINKKWITGPNYNHSSVFGRKYNSTGEKIIKGIIYEHLKEPKDSLNSIKKKYFTIPIYVSSH